MLKFKFEIKRILLFIVKEVYYLGGKKFFIIEKRLFGICFFEYIIRNIILRSRYFVYI